MVTMEMAPPSTKEGFASGRYTFQTIWNVEAPMDWAASTTPASTSFREVSTIRAMKGAADTTRGTMAPFDADGGAHHHPGEGHNGHHQNDEGDETGRC